MLGSRYRLIRRLPPHEDLSGSPGSSLWHAYDISLCREVALGLVTPERFRADEGFRADEKGPDPLRSYARRTSGTAFAAEPHVSRVYDVTETDGWVVTVAEWIPGWTFRDVVRTSPEIVDTVRTVRRLAAAVARAHHRSAFVPLTDPARLRVSREHLLVLAFPSTPASAEKSDDVAGLGALLYALLVGTWPLSAAEGSVSRSRTIAGLPAAARDSHGRTLAPVRLRPELPRELSDITMSALRAGADGCTARDVVTTLDRVLAALVPPEPGPAATPAAPTTPTTTAVPAAPGHLERFASRPARALTAAVALVVGLGALGWVVGARLTSPGAPVASADAAPVLAPPPPPSEVAVLPSGAVVYSPVQFPDNAHDAFLAVDADPATSWSSDRYFQQFPAFKPGVGLVVEFADPADVRNVWIDSPTPGTSVEIRTAPRDGGALDTTQVLGAAVTQPGITHVPLDGGDSAIHSRLLVWVTALAPTEGGFRSGFSEIGLSGRP